MVALHRIAALAARELHRLAESTAHFEEGIGLAERHGDQGTATALRRSLAGNQAMAGRFDDALDTLDRVAAAATGREATMVLAQRATVYLAADRHADAVALFRQVLPALEANGDGAAVVQVHGNLGSALMQLERFEEARHHLLAAHAGFAAQGRLVAVAEMHHMLGLCAALVGDVPDALSQFAAAKAVSEQTGVVDGIGLADQARALLAARLAPEAEAIARDAAARLDAEEVGTWAAEAYLVTAQAVLAQGRPAEAVALADAARLRFARQERAPNAALAEALILEAEPGFGSPTTVAEAIELAGRLRRFGYAIDAADLLVSAARAALNAGHERAAADAARRVPQAGPDRPVGMRVRAAYAAAIGAVVAGKSSEALDELDRGLALLEDHRLSLGATELRVRASEIGVDLAELGLRVASGLGDTGATFAWADRLQANSIVLRAARPPREDELRAAMAELRAAVRAADQAAVTKAERRVADVLRRTRGGAAPRAPTRAPPPPGTIAFFELGGDVHRIDVHGEVGAPQLAAAVADVERVVAHLGAAWRRWVRHQRTGASESAREAVVAALRAGLRELDDLLAIPPATTAAVVIPSRAVHGVPWAALGSLAGRPVRVAPSAAIAARPPRPPTPHTALLAGPGLDWAVPEVEGLADLHRSAAVLGAGTATCAAALAEMEGAGLVHVAAHGRLRLDNPMFSGVVLDDGPLMACDLEQLVDPPRVVVLSACDAGVSRVHPGNELMGLVAAFLQAGVDTVVAPVLPVDDAVSVSVMSDLHRRLARGIPPAAALAGTVAVHPEDEPEGRLARSLVCFGAG